MMTPEEIKAERVNFEAWVTEKLSFPRLEMILGRYLDPRTITGWQAWLARAEKAKLDDEAREVGA